MKPTKIKITISRGQYFVLDAYLSLFVWIFVLLVFPLFATIKQKVFPNYYFLDANTINNFIMHKSTLTKGDSYASTAAFYSALNVSKDSIVFPVISALIICGFFFWILKKSKATRMSLLELGMFLYCMLLSIVYMTLLSKDFIVLLIIIPFISLASHKAIGLVIWSVVALFYAYFFRGYWLLILALFWTLYVMFSWIKKPKQLFLIVLALLFVLAVLFKIGMGVDLDNYRTMVNDIRSEAVDISAKSMITSYIPGGGVIIGWLNVYLVWLFMMVPIPLILSLSPFYLIISFFISMLFWKFWSATKSELITKKNTTLKATICLIISFTAIQSIFEPDYGSYVRHLSPLYPLFFYVLFVSRGKTEVIKEKENESLARG
ncbi:hypothetical protein [Acerihabitans arboris]|uniref:Uncharacterized protein n=1 Tax=Acerihabitans arboris TaxID=2691583 RepID=A0A845SC60_9GAMM|nr:hypothetical protein [Acerihabitans arboris]NDL62330.1 hypothetical protein [Acerihabitans arboris]